MIRKVQAYIEKERLLTREEPVIVGLSGGADSVALLIILHQSGYNCIAAHCNFHLRREESNRDEQFSCELAHKLNIPFVKTDFDTEEYALKNQISIEMAARELRYNRFRELKENYNAQAIAVAHHQDDSVETVLMNLVRGTGIRGLHGIRPENDGIIRPLLCVTRNEIVSWLEENSFSYVTDSTNLSDAYTRNFIRLKVIPLLEQLNPSVKEAILRTSENISEAEKIFNYTIREAGKKIMDGPDRISIAELMCYPAPATILYELLRPYGFNSSTVLSVFESLDKESGKLFYSPTHCLLKDREFLILFSGMAEEKTVYTLSGEKGSCTQPVKLFWETVVIDKEFCIQKDKRIAYFDIHKLSFPLTIRTWKPGDWFIPFGMKGRKKLSDYFTDSKINRLEKSKIWLLCSGDDIIWIIGERTDERFRIDGKTSCGMIVNFSD